MYEVHEEAAARLGRAVAGFPKCICAFSMQLMLLPQCGKVKGGIPWHTDPPSPRTWMINSDEKALTVTRPLRVRQMCDLVSRDGDHSLEAPYRRAQGAGSDAQCKSGAVVGCARPGDANFQRVPRSRLAEVRAEGCPSIDVDLRSEHVVWPGPSAREKGSRITMSRRDTCPVVRP